jgi:hypothetical protein
MPRLLPLLLTAAALAAIGTPAVAKDIPGTPKILIGEFAEKPESRCIGVEHPDSEDGAHYHFGEKSFNTCGGNYCDTWVLNHTVTRNGFVLKVRDVMADTSIRRLSIVVIDKDTIKTVHRYPTRRLSPPLHRCPAWHW